MGKEARQVRNQVGARTADQAAACPNPGKARFWNRNFAKRHARRHRGTPQHPYQCACGFWHLTSSSAEGRASWRDAKEGGSL